MKRAEVFRDAEGCWFALLRHEGWDDLTPFPTWSQAFEHAEWLASRRYV